MWEGSVGCWGWHFRRHRSLEPWLLERTGGDKVWGRGCPLRVITWKQGNNVEDATRFRELVEGRLKVERFLHWAIRNAYHFFSSHDTIFTRPLEVNIITAPSCKRGNWGSQTLRNFPKVTEAVRGRAGNEGQGHSDSNGLTLEDPSVTCLLEGAFPRSEDLGALGQTDCEAAFMRARQRTHTMGSNFTVLSTSPARTGMKGNQFYF